MKIKTSFFLLFLVSVFSVANLFAQSPTTIKKKCGLTSIYAQVQITSLGDINVNPCPNRTTIFTQNVTLPAGTVIAGGMFKADNGTAAAPSYSFVNSTAMGLYRSADNVVGLSTAGVANATIGAAADTFRSASHVHTDVAATAEFAETLTPGAATLGSYLVGDDTGAGRTHLGIVNSSGTVTVQGIIVTAGDSKATVGGLSTTWTDSTNTVKTDNTAHTVIKDETGVNKYNIQKTNTAGGTTGNQTINKPGGTVNIAAAGASVVITNNTITTSSLPFVTLRTADATCTFVKSAVPTANTLTITLNAACGAETSVAWFVLN